MSRKFPTWRTSGIFFVDRYRTGTVLDDTGSIDRYRTGTVLDDTDSVDRYRTGTVLEADGTQISQYVLNDFLRPLWRNFCFIDAYENA